MAALEIPSYLEIDNFLLGIILKIINIALTMSRDLMFLSVVRYMFQNMIFTLSNDSSRKVCPALFLFSILLEI